MSDATDLVAGMDLPGPFEATAVAIDTDTVRKRRAKVTLEDDAGHRVLLVDYAGAELDVDWHEGTRYRVADCPVQTGDRSHRVTLAPATRTTVAAVESPEEAMLLVLGDTHVGRTRHPGDGSQIDPLGAFENAVGVARRIDADAVVHTGDIFHDTGVSQVELDAVEKRIFEELAEHEIPLYYVTGNHGTGASQRFLREQTAQRALVTNLTAAGVDVEGTVRLYGVDRRDGAMSDAGAHTFPTTPSRKGILVLHHTVRQLQPVDRQGSEDSWEVDLNDLSVEGPGGFDLVVSGHHHSAKQKQLADTEAIYTGAAEPMSTQSDPDDGLVWRVAVDGSDHTSSSVNPRELLSSGSSE